MNRLRTRAIARKEFLHIIRDPRSLIAALGMPILLLVLFGYALSLEQGADAGIGSQRLVWIRSVGRNLEHTTVQLLRQHLRRLLVLAEDGVGQLRHVHRAEDHHKQTDGGSDTGDLFGANP